MCERSRQGAEQDLPKHAKVAVLRRYGEASEVAEFPMPSSIEPRALLVRIDAATLCGSDLHLATGNVLAPPRLPIILGHEMMGTVVAMGPDAEMDSADQPVDVGSRLVWTNSNCGRCYACVVQRDPNFCIRRRRYMMSPCDEPPHLIGAFGEYVYVYPESGRLVVPDTVKDTWAAAATCALRTVMNGFERVPPQMTDVVVVQGAGPIGLFACAVARAAGARQVIVIDGVAERLALAEKWGATCTIDLSVSEDERLNRIRQLSDGRGASLVVEASGVPAAVSEGLRIAANNGRYLFLGQVRQGGIEIEPAAITRRQLLVTGVMAGSIRHTHLALKFMEQNAARIPFDLMFSEPYPLDAVDDAMRAMRARQEIKPTILPHHAKSNG